MISFSFCYGMEQAAIDLWNKQLPEKLADSSIWSVSQRGNIMRLYLTDPNQRQNYSYFLTHYSKNSIHLTPLVTEEKEKNTINAIALQYGLLLSAQYSIQKRFCEALDDGADINIQDKRLNTLRFIMQTVGRTTCTDKDIEQENFMYLAPSDRPVIAVYPHSSFYGFDAQCHATTQLNINVLEEIKKGIQHKNSPWTLITCVYD